jgi:peptidoglycan/LPS O-acetylase OafA/YrhL
MTAPVHEADSPRPQAEPFAPGNAGNRIIGLDGLRAISIVLVLIGHGWVTAPASRSVELAVMFLGNATLGVMTFFVVSGFLITHLLRREWEATATIRLKNFYLRRTLRILPAAFAYLVMITLLRVTGLVDTTYGDLAAAGTFLTNYKHTLPIATNGDYWFVAHFWTLSLEEQFYLFWPATILLAGLARARTVALAIVLASPLLRVLTYFAWPEARPQISIMLHTAADPIMVGCLAALWTGAPRFEVRLRRFSHPGLAIAAAVFVLAAAPMLTARYRGVFLMTAGLTMISVAIAFIMLWIIRHPGSATTRLLSTPGMRRVGVLSYSLYLWQQLFLTDRNETWTGAFPINFLMCFVAAELSYRFVERPFLGLRDRLRPGVVAQGPLPPSSRRPAVDSVERG